MPSRGILDAEAIRPQHGDVVRQRDARQFVLFRSAGFTLLGEARREYDGRADLAPRARRQRLDCAGTRQAQHLPFKDEPDRIVHEVVRGIGNGGAHRFRIGDSGRFVVEFQDFPRELVRLGDHQLLRQLAETLGLDERKIHPRFQDGQHRRIGVAFAVGVDVGVGEFQIVPGGAADECHVGQVSHPVHDQLFLAAQAVDEDYSHILVAGPFPSLFCRNAAERR